MRQLRGAARIALALLIVAGTLELGSCRTAPEQAGPQPGVILIDFDLDHQPTPGWRITGTDIGLPADTKLNAPFGAGPFSTDGNRAYFLTSCGVEPHCADPSPGWVYGIDLRTGSSLFEPVELDGFGLTGSCYQNGPATAVCHSRPRRADDTQGELWLLDLERGAITHTGSTDLALRDTDDKLFGFNQVGEYLVLTKPGVGAHGLGADGRPSWFIPGSGTLIGWPSTVLTQIPNPDDPTYRIFSVADGAELTPDPPEGVTLRRATAYPDGFAYQYEGSGEIGVLFYDARGILQKRQTLSGYSLLDDVGFPIVLDENVFRVFSVAGEQLAEIPAEAALSATPQFHLLGDQLLLKFGNYSSGDWQRWDLTTGTLVGNCEMSLHPLVGSDGRIALVADGNDVVATDLSSCQPLWRLTAGSYHQIRQIGRTLLNLGANEIVALRPRD